MTEDRIALLELIGKSRDADFLCEMVGFAAQRLMDLEVERLCGTGYGERTGATRAGTIDLRIPKLQRGSYLRPVWNHGAQRRRR